MTELTYKQLDQALQTVGFERLVHATYIAYYHKPTDTIFALPRTTVSPIVMNAHLIAADRTVIGREVATEDQWFDAIEQAQHEEQEEKATAKLAVPA